METKTTTLTLSLVHLYHLTADSNNQTGYTIEEVLNDDSEEDDMVDEVDDERTTLAFAIGELMAEEPEEIGVFVMHNKLKPKKAEFPEAVKHVFVGKDIEDVWVDYPWDARDIVQHERDAARGGVLEVNEAEAKAAYRN